MPIYCENKIGFISDETGIGELKRLYDVLYGLYEEYGYGGYIPLEEINLAHNLNLSRIPFDNEITFIDELCDGDTRFRISTITHRSPTNELWENVVKQYPGVQYVYVAEEHQYAIYINTDVNGIYFPERYVIYTYMGDLGDKKLPVKYFPGGMNYDELILEDDKRHFNSFEELQNFTKKITGKTFEDLEQMNAYLEEAMEAYNRENDISNENVVIIYKYAEG